MRQLRLIPVLLCLLSLNVARHVTAQADCGSGVAQRLVVGGEGWVVPGQAANRLRATPNGTQIGSIAQGDVFNVIGGPECANDVSWWQVQLSDGTTGWTGEGVDGQAFLEPVTAEARGGGNSGNTDSSGAEVNTNADCSGVSTALNVGMLAQVSVPYAEIQQFYGNPLVPGALYSLPQQVDGADLWRLFSGREPNMLVLIQSGPVCFNGAFLWKIDATLSRDGADGSVWINEIAGGVTQLTPSAEQPTMRTAFQPTHIPLERNSSAPIIDRTAQLLFSGGGGCGDIAGCIGLGPWHPMAREEDACLVGWVFSTVDYYEPDCMDLYPFANGETVSVILRRPDGSIYSQVNHVARSISYVLNMNPNNLDQDGNQFIEVYGVQLRLQHPVGDPAGVWTVEAHGQERTITQVYALRERQFMDLQCEGVTPVVVFNDFEPLSTQTLVLAEALGTDEAEGDLIFNFKEIDRWELQMDHTGALIAIPEFSFGDGVVALDGPNGWEQNVDVRNGTDFDAFTPNPCPSYFTASEAAQHPIASNTFATGSFVLHNNGGLMQRLNPNTFYVFQGHQGDRIDISVEGLVQSAFLSSDGAALEPTIQLQDPSGETIAQGDNQLSAFTLPEEGLYTIELGYNNTGELDVGIQSLPFEADYSLTLASTSQSTTPNTTDLTFGNQVSGALPDKSTWTFAGASGETITISAQSTDFDIQIHLLDLQGNVLADDDDGGGGMSARITMALQQTGIYTIEISSWNDKTGAYSLAINS